MSFKRTYKELKPHKVEPTIKFHHYVVTYLKGIEFRGELLITVVRFERDRSKNR